jgi:hypothetical protein
MMLGEQQRLVFSSSRFYTSTRPLPVHPTQRSVLNSMTSGNDNNCKAQLEMEQAQLEMEDLQCAQEYYQLEEKALRLQLETLKLG